MKIIHIITGLGNGGAETMLYKLLHQIDKSKYEIVVLSMLDKDCYGEKIEKLGIKVFELKMKSIPTVGDFVKACRICKGADIIQTWMYHADFFGYLVSKVVKPKKLIWGIRHSNLQHDKSLTMFIAKINSLLSHNVDVITVNSTKGYEVHKDMGYSTKRMMVIPNGFNLGRFKLIDRAKEKLTSELNIPSEKLLIGSVGRWNKIKGYIYLLEAAKLIKESGLAFNLILCGSGLAYTNNELVKIIKDYCLEENVHLLGPREDIATIMSALDIFILPSLSEGFSNVVGEAMACERPCIVTNVGDNAYIVGETGMIVEPSDSEGLANAIQIVAKMDKCDRTSIGRKARERVVQYFDIEKVTEKFQRLYT